jgi:fatty acyl-CoA reductase
MTLHYFLANNQWDFDNRVQVLFRERLNDLEEDRYKVNSRGVLPEEFYEKGIFGARRYILKTPDSQIPAARRMMKIMYVVDKVCKTIIYGGLSYWLLGLILSLFSGANVITTLIKIVFCICLFVL